MSSHETDDFWRGMLIAGIAVTFLAIIGFGKEFKLDFQTSSRVLGGMFLVCVLTVAAWKIQIISISQAWPISMAFIWLSFWPALDYWAIPHQPVSIMPHFGIEVLPDPTPAWFAAWYIKTAGLILIPFACIWIQSQIVQFIERRRAY